MTAPLIGGAAVVLAIALVWYFGPDGEPPPALESEVRAIGPEPAVDVLLTAGLTPAAPTDAPLAELRASPAPTLERAPLPGETPATPMTQMLTDRQSNVIIRRVEGSNEVVPPGLTAGELEFAAEPVDSAWAPGAEADLLATFAQMPGLKLIDLQVECRSTMCRLQLTQPREAPADSRPLSGAIFPGNQRGSSGGFNLLRDSIGLEARWMMVIGDGTGPMRSVGYFWREGYARRDCRKDGHPAPCEADGELSSN